MGGDILTAVNGNCLIIQQPSRSLTYIENKNGDRHSPCLTPNLHLNVSDFSLLLNTLVRTWLYIEQMMSIIFPRTPKFNSLYHKYAQYDRTPYYNL